MLKINKWHELNSNGNVKTIAIVGNGPNAIDYRIGDIIDNADLVIRMNRFEISDKFIPFIGKKTDVFITNCYKKDLNKTTYLLKWLGVKTIWTSIPPCNFAPHFASDLDDAEKEFNVYDIYTPSCSYFFLVSPKSLVYKFILYVLIFLFKMRKIMWPVPSTGLLAILFALKLKPKNVIITGYNFFTSDKSNYFDNQVSPTKTHHVFNREPFLLKKIISRNIHTHFQIAISEEILNGKKFSNVSFFKKQNTLNQT